MANTWQDTGMLHGERNRRTTYLVQLPHKIGQRLPQPLLGGITVVIHTTERLVTKLKEDLKNIQLRNSGWYTRKTPDYQFQIHRDRVQRPTDGAIKIRDYMEIKTTYKQKIWQQSLTSRAMNNTTTTTWRIFL
eukprot:3151021-Amphidinium_carterae.1